MRIRKRLAQLGFIMVALPVLGWGLEQLAKQADERRPNSGAGKWLRQGSDVAHGFGRGPLSSRLRPPRNGPQAPLLGWGGCGGRSPPQWYGPHP